MAQESIKVRWECCMCIEKRNKLTKTKACDVSSEHCIGKGCVHEVCGECRAIDTQKERLQKMEVSGVPLGDGFGVGFFGVRGQNEGDGLKKNVDGEKTRK